MLIRRMGPASHPSLPDTQLAAVTRERGAPRVAGRRVKHRACRDECLEMKCWARMAAVIKTEIPTILLVSCIN